MAPRTSINSYLFIIFTLSTTNIQSQRVYCGGGPGSVCYCPTSSDPTYIPGSTCILDCSQPDMCSDHMTLMCRAGDPCEIDCSGDGSCHDGTNINGIAATNVKITCGRDDSCSNQMAIQCGTGDCLLECMHRQSCQDWIHGTVQTFRARSFNCHGIGCPHWQLPFQFSLAPTAAPTAAPSKSPTPSPTNPTQHPTKKPTNQPTVRPTNNPTNKPTFNPSLVLFI